MLIEATDRLGDTDVLPGFALEPGVFVCRRRACGEEKTGIGLTV